MHKNLKLWVAFNLVFGEHLRSIQLILQSFASIEEVFQAKPSDIIALGIEKSRARSLFSQQNLDRASRTIAWLSKKNYTVLTIEDPGYPEYLREIFDPPVVLYCAGDPQLLDSPAVAIVGARKPSAYGRAVAERLASDLAGLGLVVVSGMARGLDAIAHWGALKAGKTIAVLGSGLNKIYPKENMGLFEKIMETGVVITEFPPDSAPLGFHFPLRNRIISGLSMALVAVEATRKSGSLISAKLALEQNREVMAVPGNITSKLSEGTNWLIKTGAKLVDNWQDIVEELPPGVKTNLLTKAATEDKKPALNAQQSQIYESLEVDALTHVDTLVEKSKLSVSEVLSILLYLELEGLVIQSPGKYFQRKL